MLVIPLACWHHVGLREKLVFKRACIGSWASEAGTVALGLGQPKRARPIESEWSYTELKPKGRGKGPLASKK